MAVAPSGNARPELEWFLGRTRSRRVRTMRDFAEQEIVVPDGPFEGRRFRCHRQPYTGLWFDAVDRRTWCRCVATGPTQSGKTLACFVIPLLYHLFEVGETVICGLPDMDMAIDKWREDILPAIEQSRFRDLLPTKGGGSRGGRVESIQFVNGATLKFMSGGGGDKSRAGFTSRVVVITETDGMDRPGAASRESDKITQLEARTRAYGSRKRIYMECTVSTEEGRTWQEYQAGTKSRIVLPCPHCHGWVSPEREHLVGWQEAATQAEARSNGKFCCPACGEAWTDEQRVTANRNGQLVHDGQDMDEDGNIQGEPTPADTLGFRWSGIHNLFLAPGDFAADEWRAARSPDEENAEKELRQFVWCVPVAPSKLDETALQVEQIVQRQRNIPRGLIPSSADLLTAAIDLGKYLTHWIVVAWSPGATPHVVDYGRIEVASPDMGVEQALLVALRQFGDMINGGWPVVTDETDNDDSPGRLHPKQVWIDAGYMTPVVYEFCRESKAPFQAAVGRGAAQQRAQYYNRPTSTGSVVKLLGEGYHLNRIRAEHQNLAEVDADHWKTFAHQRLSTPLDQPGALTLFQAPSNDHIALAKHLTAERKTEEFIAGKGVVTKWERVRRNNHWFDALYNTCAAGHLCGVRLIGEPPPKREPIKLSELQKQRERERMQRGLQRRSAY